MSVVNRSATVDPVREEALRILREVGELQLERDRLTRELETEKRDYRRIRREREAGLRIGCQEEMEKMEAALFREMDCVHGLWKDFFGFFTAQELQRRKDEEYTRQQRILKELEVEKERRRIQLENDEKFAQEWDLRDCMICLEKYDAEDCHRLSACGCVHHRECLAESIRQSLGTREFPLKCSNPKCRMEIDVDDLTLLVHPDTVAKFYDFTLKSYVDSHAEVIWCPGKKCQNAMIVEDGEPRLRCSQCNADYCIRCQTEWHENSTCEKYQEFLKTLKTADAESLRVIKRETKPCPRCKIPLQKVDGCNFIQCKCGCGLCWVCGKEKHVKGGCTNANHQSH